MLLFRLLDRNRLAAEPRQLNEFFLNLLQPFLPLAVGNFGFSAVLATKAVPLIGRLDVGNLRPETRNFFSKDDKVIHLNRIPHPSGMLDIDFWGTGRNPFKISLLTGINANARYFIQSLLTVSGRKCDFPCRRNETMTYEVLKGTFRLTNLENESPEYLAKREELRLAEIDLMRRREDVAALRRALPPGPTVQDYVFSEGPANLDAGDSPVKTVRLSELFTAPDRSLVVYHLMYGKKQTTPCPMCTMWMDGWNGIARHLAQNVDVVVAAAADLKDLRSFARDRGWKNLRLLSCGQNSFKYDLGSEDREGGQDSALSVFTKDRDGTPRHFVTAHPRMASDIKERGIDLLTPVYNVLDMIPQGRGDWYASLDYGLKAKTA